MENRFQQTKRVSSFPRLPLLGCIDLTYRCNNNCRHCWIRIPPGAEEKNAELTFEEIKLIVNQARQSGCHSWSISGGEPMFRPDFYEIFDYLTTRCAFYLINTNGTLITPRIAKLMVRKGSKMVSLYGATAKVHDFITATPGSFEATLRGLKYLKEAKAGFLVQLVPMKDNYYEFNAMVDLAKTLSKNYSIGADWLHFSASADSQRNKEIIRQRLPPEEVIKLAKPSLAFDEWFHDKKTHCQVSINSRYHFSECIKNRREFHIDPYGKMSFCSFIKDPDLRYDLRGGTFKDGWDKFIPSLAKSIKITKEYKKNCGSCKIKQDCYFCPVYGYLENNGNFNRKIEYLCALANESHKFKENWRRNHRCYFKIADITLQVEFDLPINEQTFHPKFKRFQVKGPGEDNIVIRHYFSLPDLEGKSLGQEVYRRRPWAIYKNNNFWVYRGISPIPEDKSLHRIAVFHADHSRAIIYRDTAEAFLSGNLLALTLFTTDQVLLARILADRNGCYLHSSGINFKNRGLLFVGHSEAGKSTIATMFKDRAEILCDDRIIVRKHAGVFKIYGTWSHGEVPEISAGSAPLAAILFLHKSEKNYLELLKDKKVITRKLLTHLIRPFVTIDWWEKTLIFLEGLSNEVPCYDLYFNKSGEVISLLKKL